MTCVCARFVPIGLLGTASQHALYCTYRAVCSARLDGQVSKHFVNCSSSKRKAMTIPPQILNRQVFENLHYRASEDLGALSVRVIAAREEAGVLDWFGYRRRRQPWPGYCIRSPRDRKSTRLN